MTSATLRITYLHGQKCSYEEEVTFYEQFEPRIETEVVTLVQLEDCSFWYIKIEKKRLKRFEGFCDGEEQKK